ncbi:hypothetical protein [Candidatus Clostridium stratigraminis]|uniref:Uncharacterized protein n=1 Tax=Candidatus Clostridium stratigraminis TaxID=3381661 RepID=A0ABW8T763_9CLOT
MGKMYTQEEAENIVKNLGNGDYELISPYKGSNEDYTFKHLSCGTTFTRRWSNFIDAFRQGSPNPKCSNPKCK